MTFESIKSSFSQFQLPFIYGLIKSGKTKSFNFKNNENSCRIFFTILNHFIEDKFINEIFSNLTGLEMSNSNL
jgi:hypothetical protein